MFFSAKHCEMVITWLYSPTFRDIANYSPVSATFMAYGQKQGLSDNLVKKQTNH